MTLAPIGNVTPQHQAADADEKAIADARKAAEQFESIFLRQLLGALEKTGGPGGSSQGAGIYKSMMVGALADSASANGGIGLADVVFKAMLPPALASSAAAHGTAASKPVSGAAGSAANSLKLGGKQ
jgi:peptidoglycan hydrolase FlgJ